MTQDCKHPSMADWLCFVLDKKNDDTDREAQPGTRQILGAVYQTSVQIGEAVPAARRHTLLSLSTEHDLDQLQQATHKVPSVRAVLNRLVQQSFQVGLAVVRGLFAGDALEV